MLARIWRTGLDESRAADYERFALERSLPMFRRQPGFRGVYLGRCDGGRVVITLWTDREAIEALDASPDYRATVAAITATGFLRPPQAVEVIPIDHAWMPMTPPEAGSPG